MPVHLFIVHFPLVLLLVGALVDLGGAAARDRALRYRAGQLIMVGGFASFVGFLTGEGAKIVALNNPAIDVALIANHEQWASLGAWALLGIAIVRGMFRNRLDDNLGWLNLALGVLGAVLVVFITISGTTIRH